MTRSEGPTTISDPTPTPLPGLQSSKEAPTLCTSTQAALIHRVISPPSDKDNEAATDSTVHGPSRNIAHLTNKKNDNEIIHRTYSTLDVKLDSEALRMLTRISDNTDGVLDAMRSIGAREEEKAAKERDRLMAPPFDFERKCNEIVSYALDRFVEHGTSLFERALNQPLPEPSSGEEKSSQSVQKGLYWTSLKTFQSLGKVSPVPPLPNFSDEKSPPPGQIVDVDGIPARESEIASESGKRKLDAIEEELGGMPDGEKAHTEPVPEPEPEPKRFRHSSRPRSIRGS